MKTFTAILKKKFSKDTEGVICIQMTENRKNKSVSLKIKIPEKFWDNVSKRVKKTKQIDYISINKQITDKLEELENTQTLKTNKQSFVEYFNRYINRIHNTGSKIKYQQVLNSLIKFKKEIEFNEITTDFVFELYKHFKNTQSTNTSNHYLKIVKQVLNESIKERLVNYYFHPFSLFKFKNERVSKNSLDETEIRKLIQTDIDKNDFLYDIRNKFLFQIFSQGMRISDLMLLKWSDIKDMKLDYVMFKTGKHMVIDLNDMLIDILSKQLDKLCESRIYVHNIYTDLKPRLDSLIERRNERLRNEHGAMSGFDNITEDIIDVKEIRDVRLLRQQIHESYKLHIDYVSKLHSIKDRYIFDFVDFEIKNPKNITEFEYKSLKNKTIVYNRHLKALQKKAKSSITYKSHLSRHSYASLLLNRSVDLFVISQSLGHTKINITEKYLSGFNNDKTAEENKKVSDMFFKIK